MTDCTTEIMIAILIILLIVIVGIIFFLTLFFYLLSKLMAGCVRLVLENRMYLNTENVFTKHNPIIKIDVEEYRNDLREGL